MAERFEYQIESETPQFGEYFRDGEPPAEGGLWWHLDAQAPLLEALRAIHQGPASAVRLRLWVFLTLMALPEGRWSRDQLNRHFHVLHDDALELALRRLREVDLLVWDAGDQHYSATPLAQQLLGLLAPLTAAPAPDDELATLLAGVAGAQQLGTLQAGQLQSLQAQLTRLNDEFADAIASGSEFRLRKARGRFERALGLVDKASDALTAIIRGAENRNDARLERLARDLGLAQARLLAMASQFNRALQQADRQRISLGSTGITTTDVRRWLQGQGALERLLDGAFSTPVSPVFVAQHELLDSTEGEFERLKPPSRSGEALPGARPAPPGRLEVEDFPPELGVLRALLERWRDDPQPERPLAPAVLGGGYAKAAYRAQLLPLMGDPQSADLAGATGELARQPWRARFAVGQGPVDDPHVRWMSDGRFIRLDASLQPATPPSDEPAV
ncbi:hypothetical protein [Inhella gelatinilytica]|uniref:Uncharacterized protein n=1 Tax=Inhella gelatinilytica TaxID=2795030 RepID=A0A931IWX7_9BURK|nr:hypothetical protein [Inhella gelatinilytica]MBH9553076.1 hypothetical protein [Inhella gelatinilytica]